MKLHQLSNLLVAISLGLTITACGNEKKGPASSNNQITDPDTNKDKNIVPDNQDPLPENLETVTLKLETLSATYMRSTKDETILVMNAYDQIYDEEFMPLNGFPTYSFELHIHSDAPLKDGDIITFTNNADSVQYATVNKYYEQDPTEYYGTKGGKLTISTINSQQLKGSFSGLLLQEYDCDGEEESHCFYIEGGKSLKVADFSFDLDENSMGYYDCDTQEDAEYCY